MKLRWFPIQVHKRVRHPMDGFIEHLKVQQSDSTMCHAFRIGMLQISFGWR